MGVTISATNSSYVFEMGYGRFFNLRKNIAMALDKEFGENYADLSFCLTESQFADNDKKAYRIIQRNHLNDDYEDVIAFLYASDGGGSISYKTCQSIFELMKDIDYGNKGFQYANRSNNDYETFKKFLKECYSKRRKMKWY